MELIRSSASCLGLLVLLAATGAAGVAAAKNKSDQRPPLGGLVLTLGWAGSLLAALIFFAIDLALASGRRMPWLSLLTSYLNTFMTLVIVVGLALLAPRKGGPAQPESTPDG